MNIERARRLIVAALAVTWTFASGTASAGFRVGERVLGKREITTQALGKEYKSYYYYPATIETANDKEYVLSFDDGEHATVPAVSVTAFDWKPQQTVYCRAKGEANADYVSYRISSIAADTIEDSNRLTNKTMPIKMCRSSDPMDWWNRMSPLFKDYETRKPISAMPKSGSKLVSPAVAKSTLSSYLSTIGGGSIIKIKSCVATGKQWESITVGGQPSSRRLALACAVGVPIPPDPKKNEACEVIYGFCDQKLIADSQYAGCVWEHQLSDPNRIACTKVK